MKETGENPEKFIVYSRRMTRSDGAEAWVSCQAKKPIDGKTRFTTGDWRLMPHELRLATGIFHAGQ